MTVEAFVRLQQIANRIQTQIDGFDVYIDKIDSVRQKVIALLCDQGYTVKRVSLSNDDKLIATAKRR